MTYFQHKYNNKIIIYIYIYIYLKYIFKFIINIKSNPYHAY
jgi:hypothetical protein